jgi:hypothetical protein
MRSSISNSSKGQAAHPFETKRRRDLALRLMAGRRTRPFAPEPVVALGTIALYPLVGRSVGLTRERSHILPASNTIPLLLPSNCFVFGAILIAPANSGDSSMIYGLSTVICQTMSKPVTLNSRDLPKAGVSIRAAVTRDKQRDVLKTNAWSAPHMKESVLSREKKAPSPETGLGS